MMDIHILLISSDAKERKVYESAIRTLDVKVTAVPSLKGLTEKVKDLFLNGVAMDMSTKIMALKMDREFIHTTFRKFPVAHLTLGKEMGKIRLFYPGQPPGATLKDFIDGECRTFTPRKLAHHIRKDLHFNVLLSRNPEMVDCEKTVSVDVSEGGCFIFSTQEWVKGDMVWLKILELSHHDPIGARVKRCVRWGEAMQVPGIGLQFDEMKPLQRRELEKRLWGIAT
ncbi:MAG: PilZ domain-containing protein [Deltaproteobacteria bacterium]|nr:PilZ domain-containing protein [Deltaproteobacteria bacterium]